MSSRSPDEFRLGAPLYDRRPRAGREPVDPHELLHRARRLTADGHPAAGGAWERAATALRRAGGSITPGDHADALDATALDCRGRARPAAGTLFSRAADLHERAGQRGKALVSRARALLSGPEPGATVCAGLEELGERATSLHATGQATAAETATVLLLRCRARADLLDTGPDPVTEAAALRGELTGLIAFAAPHRAAPAVLAVLAETRALLGRVTAPDDPAAALSGLRAAVADHRAGGRPWQAAESRLLLAGVLRATGAHQEAAALLRAALGATATATSLHGADRARLCLALARTLGGADGGPDRAEEVALLAEAVRHADAVAGDSRLSTLARLALGIARAEHGRWREASAVLEEALSGLAEDGEDDETARVRARAWLAYCALCLGEPGRAAREFARAAAEARRWDDRRHGAALSHLTAYALCADVSPEKAARAYERAADLWRSVGDHASAARSLRSRARRVREVWGADAAEVVEEEALREAARGLPGDDGEPDGARGWLRGLPEPYGPPGRYQVGVYGEVGGAGTGPRTSGRAGTGAGPRGRRRPEEQSVSRVQGCV
ncbi:hypothetical protein GCM10010222_46310 [Streptomyces tanashiensis]|uniref:hypothetical protein n=1 Tax=Streptomyces tanashiensis TaxID=67367 RepID=UPI0016783940|nr:hypothetical protein [Streptomyces tanashiensis]GGS99297.1 hypothetical protein GCM10010222_46310 [Streptomyces tanashiensis]